MKKKPPKARTTKARAGSRSAKRPSPKKKVAVKPSKTQAKLSETKVGGSRLDSKEQTQFFDRAMQFFHKRDFAKARELFERATVGPLSEMTHSAHMHLRMCDHRLSATQLAPKTPEDHYTFGVTLMNQGKLEQAQQHLLEAAAGRPDADHFHYGLALCCGLRGDFHASATHLKRAIELAPANRIAARNDPDFQAIAAHSPLREILYPERGRTA